MLCVIPFWKNDASLARNLLKWIIELGGCRNHKALLVVDSDTPLSEALEINGLANEAFSNSILITTEEHYEGWPEAANWNFVTAAEHIHTHLHETFLWLEPDSVPLKQGWLEALESSYQGGLMGQIYKFEQPGSPFAPIDVMSGVAVYPGDAFKLICGCIKANPKKAWDVSASGPMVKHGKHTNLIQHFFGQVGLAPTFVNARTNNSPPNALTIADLSPGAVLFHRNKDGTLIDILRRRLFPPTPQERFAVIFNICTKDVDLMMANLDWISELGRCPNDIAVLSYDRTLHSSLAARLQQFASRTFGQVRHNVYSTPRKPDFVYASKWAFRGAAQYAQKVLNRPWLWYEADFWPMKSHWLERLQAEYRRCGKQFMGSIVPGMGHVNGTAIYPADTFSICASIHRDDGQAFDMAMKPEMEGKTHDAGQLMQHVWVNSGGRLLPHGVGVLPSFGDPNLFSQILPSAVTFHRCKDTTLRDKLRGATKT